MTAALQLPSLPVLKAELAKRSLLHFTKYTFPAYETNWHHQIVADHLDRVLTGEIRQLLICMPPQNGKSELVSRRFPAYVLGKQPDCRIITCSYGSSLATDMSRDVMRIMESPEYKAVFPGTRLASGKDDEARTSTHFQVVGRRGYYISAGIMGSMTGRTSDIGIVDDPIKNRQEAESETFRKSVWDQFISSFYTRQFGNTGRTVLCLTRWHEDDLAGRLIKLAEDDPRADKWTVLSFPAIAEGVLHPLDTREYGQPLWPEKYPMEWLERRQAVTQEYDWAALYQQTPAPAGGGMFKREWFQVVDQAPPQAQRCRGWDLAATVGGGDHSAGCKMAQAGTTYYIEDMIRRQYSPAQVDSLMLATAQQDGTSCIIREEREGGSSGKYVTASHAKLLHGFNYREIKVDKDKATRAGALASQAEFGNVKLVRGGWNAAFLDELCSFPYGRHDDQVDAASLAFNQLALTNTSVVAAILPNIRGGRR